MYPSYQDMFSQSRNMYQNNEYYGRGYNQQMEQSINNLIRVTGIDGAKAYQMPANSTVALFDNNDDYMYIKTTDGAGFPSIRTFRFEEVFENKQMKISEEYVNKDEFDTFKQEVMDYVQQFIQQQTTTNKAKQNFSTNGISEQLGKSRSSCSTDVSE